LRLHFSSRSSPQPLRQRNFLIENASMPRKSIHQHSAVSPQTLCACILLFTATLLSPHPLSPFLSLPIEPRQRRPPPLHSNSLRILKQRPHHPASHLHHSHAKHTEFCIRNGGIQGGRQRQRNYASGVPGQYDSIVPQARAGVVPASEQIIQHVKTVCGVVCVGGQ
jgi:hypothetical protein